MKYITAKLADDSTMIMPLSQVVLKSLRLVRKITWSRCAVSNDSKELVLLNKTDCIFNLTTLTD